MAREFRIGEWLVEPDLNSITRANKKTSVEPKVIEVLAYLAEHPGEVLSKNQILKAVWPDTFVSDEVLRYSISELRKALNDDAKNPTIIEPFCQRLDTGYVVQDHRFIGIDLEGLICPLETPLEFAQRNESIRSHIECARIVGIQLQSRLGGSDSAQAGSLRLFLVAKIGIYLGNEQRRLVVLRINFHRSFV